MAAKSDELRTKFSTFRHKTDEAKASLAADKSENAVLSSLNKLKAQGRIKGFHVCHSRTVNKCIADFCRAGLAT